MIRIICGPTAAGKSAVAMALAERRGLTIVSADSRQVYRGFDIGTAKPSAADRARVPHVGLDVASPLERWSAARWADDAVRSIEVLGEDRVVVVGGTGLYLRALTAPLFDEPMLDPGRRAALAAEIDAWPTDRLRQWTARLDPARAHLGRAQLLRAVEVALLTGRPLSEWHRTNARAPRFRARWLVVDPAESLPLQVASRLDAMLAGGWADEVRDLARTVAPDAPAWQACGYRVMRDMVAGALGGAAARNAILVQTRQYAKRQRTWFRHQLEGLDVTRIDPRAPATPATVDAWWNAEDAT